MDQINFNTPTEIPSRNIIKSPLDNSTSTEILVNQNIVNNIDPDPSKDIEHLQYHT